ncbi:unnamed protein product [Sphagnum compactum]
MLELRAKMYELSMTKRCRGLQKPAAENSSKRWCVVTYITTRSGPGHLPVFTCLVEVAGMTSSGEAARTKKQAEKYASMAAWSALKQFVNWTITPPLEADLSEEHKQNTIAWALAMPMTRRVVLPQCSSCLHSQLLDQYHPQGSDQCQQGEQGRIVWQL